MYYFKKEDNYMIKYDVKIDEKRLNELKLEIIEKCSHIIHKHYYTTKKSIDFDYLRVRNYKEKFHRVISYNDFYSEDEDEYEVEYDYYEFDKLVNYIDMILYGDYNAIESIYSLEDDNVDKENSLLKKQRKIISKLYNNNFNEMNEKIEELYSIQKELEELKKENELNKNQISSINYKEKVLKCITLNEIDKINIEDINKVNAFFNNEKIIKKILKK